MYSTDTGSPYVEVKQKKVRKYSVSEVPGFIFSVSIDYELLLSCCYRSIPYGLGLPGIDDGSLIASRWKILPAATFPVVLGGLMTK